ncbi:MAG: PD-(D/E)XK nuclease family protein [Candidatus Riflebacteria bacterium]|nr:PD-(D/E)XK nuclease family protein [Candidatus Riflebacteria bacterium]
MRLRWQSADKILSRSWSRAGSCLNVVQDLDDHKKDDRADAIDQARRMLVVWLTWERPMGRILAVEQSFEVEVAPWLPKLQGRVDVVTEMEDAIELSDVKTSRTHWSEDEIESGRGPLVLYREGLRDLTESIGKPLRLAWEVIG